jgi:hypothetical protein
VDFTEPGLFSTEKAEVRLCVDPSFWFGFTAGELRARGGKVPAEIPDCAEYQEPGIFVWTNIEYEWKFESLPRSGD